MRMKAALAVVCIDCFIAGLSYERDVLQDPRNAYRKVLGFLGLVDKVGNDLLCPHDVDITVIYRLSAVAG